MDSARKIAGKNCPPALYGVVLTVAALVAFRPAAADDALDDYRLAVGFYNKEQWKLAAEGFQAFLKSHGEHPKAEVARFYYGLALVKLDDFKQAREVLRNFVKDHPKSRDAVAAGYWIGHSSYFLDDFASAEVELGRFVTAAPQDPLTEWALPYLADAELRLKKPEAALKHFQQALDGFSKGEMAEDARFGLARSYELLKKTPEAVRTYQEIAANRTGTRAAEALLNLGDLHFEAGDFAAARQAFESIEERFPESPQISQARLNLGFSLYQLREFQKAAAQFDKAARTEKYSAEAALWKGLCLKSLADLKQAVSVLKAAYEAHRDSPIAENLLFQWAVCTERLGERDKARELFVAVADRWPKGKLADESLHAACLAAVDGAKFAEAEALLARFDRDYAGNRLRFRQEILKGRVLAARNDFTVAATHYQTVLSASEIDSTKDQARFYLGFALQKQAKHNEVLEATEPLAARVLADKSLNEYAAVHVLRAASHLALAKAAAAKSKPGEDSPERAAQCAAAVESARKYREALPNGPLAGQALAVAAIADALARKKDAALADLELLRKEHPRAPELDQASYELGSIAFSWGDFAMAERLFAQLASKPQDSPYHARALADLGWSQHRQKKDLEAAATFARLVTIHPDDELANEAAFMRGQALEAAGKLAEAQAAFADAWKRPGNSEEVFLAGWHSAKLLARRQKIAEADAVFDEVLKRFPKHKRGDELLDEWAGFQYDAQNASRADEILRRLTTEYPSSKLADSALFSLAESDFLAGKLDEARTQLIALSKSPSADETVQQKSLYQLMQIEMETARWDDLGRMCDDSLARFPDGIYRREMALARAKADFNLGNFKACEERLISLLSLKDDAKLKKAPWLAEAWVILAETRWRLKAYDAVAAAVAEFRAGDPQSPLLYQADEVLGRSFKSQAKWPEAREAFERVIKSPDGKLSETAAKSQLLIAETYFMQHDYATALKEYLKVEILYKFPDYQSGALFMAGECQREMKQWRESAKTFDDLLRHYPKSKEAPQARERLEMMRKKLASG